jgi:hypothetical protein
MARINNIPLPPQRLSFINKTVEWRKDNMDHADTHSFYHSESVRQTLRNKIINLNLYNGIVDVRDLSAVVNPYNMDANFVPDNIPHHPIVVPKIDLLVGEETKRRFDWKVIVINPDAVSKKEEGKKQELMRRLTEYLQSNYEEEELKTKMAELEKYMKYDWQDIREKMANQILRHYWAEQEFDMLFNKGFKDALLMAEEIYQVDIVSDEPKLDKLNPLKVYSIRSGNSDRIEDSNLIILEDHWSPGKIIDYYYNELKPADIDYINDYSTKTSKSSYSDDHNNHTLLRDALPNGGMDFTGGGMDTFFNLAEINGHYFNSNYTDENGNIRVLRVYWKSLKKIKKVKYYSELGEEEYKIMSEEYVVDEEMGEEATIYWVNEWWEGTKIGEDIYVNMRPRKIQFNSLNNPSTGHAGIIGQVYNTNQGKAVSLIDRCKNYQYMYDVIWDRLNKAISTNYGKIFELDLAKVPENWEIDKWLHFAVVNKIAVVDSFKEGNHGASTGKLAGSMQQSGKVMDMETGTYIQQHVQLLEFIKNEMGEIAGVTKQREGAIHQNETASGVERSVNQSSHITEFWFAGHEKVKLRVLSAFLQAAKVALKGNNKKVQYILDDQTIEVLNMEGEEFNEAEYGLVATSSSKATELEQALKGHAQAFLQNGGSFSTIMDIYFSPSLSDMRRKIEIAEDDMHQRNSQSQEQQNKIAQQAQADSIALQQALIAAEEARNIRDNETRRYVAELQASLKAEEGDDDSNGVDDTIDKEKLSLDREKMLMDNFNKSRELSNDMSKHKDQMEVEMKKISAMRQKATVKK